MKKVSTLLLALSAAALISIAASYSGSNSANQPTVPEYKVITVVESIIPMGIGRSRIIENKTEVNPNDATTDRIDGKSSDQGRIKRKDLKVDEFSETKLLNFFSGVGINFQNIASNDAQIAARINEMSWEGWELLHVTSGVESDGGEGDGQGIYITRLVFKR